MNALSTSQYEIITGPLVYITIVCAFRRGCVRRSELQSSSYGSRRNTDQLRIFVIFWIFPAPLCYIAAGVRGAFGACANKQGVVWSVSGEGMSTDSEGNGDPQPSKEKEKETKQAYVPVSSYRYLFRTYIQGRAVPTEVVAIAVAPTVTNYDATTYKDFPTDLHDVAVGGNVEQVAVTASVQL